MNVEPWYFNGCPHWPIVAQRLQALAVERTFEVTHRLVSTPEDAQATGFLGSPTIRVNGRDPFARGDEPFGLSCRLYQTPDGAAGAPSLEQLCSALDV